MSNEWKVATLEQAKRLVELGVVLKCERYWFEPTDAETRLLTMNVHPKLLGPVDYPAPDVAELGILLPDQITTAIIDGVVKIPDMWFLKISKTGWDWMLSYSKIAGDNETFFIRYDSEAQTRAAAVIYLIENKRATWDQEKQMLIAV